jgi:phosphoribosylaminoimidazole (AIR) synthetase
MVVVPEKEAVDVIERLENLGESVYSIGFIEKRGKNQPPISFI